MKKQNKNIVTSEKSAEINEKRVKALKGNYQKPQITKVILSEKPVGNRTDMASVINV